MKIRRLVTGHNALGQSVFLSDGDTPRAHSFEHTPGFFNALIWETKRNATIPSDTTDAAVGATSFVPEPGGTNLMFVTFPPDSVMDSPAFDPAAAVGEHIEQLPGLADKFEAEHPGMHTTDTIDYGILIEGELYLELDDGEERRLALHDVVVQNGTRHAWRNKSERPATMLFVLIGATRNANAE